MNLEEACKFKQKYWALEAKYERWPPCAANKYTQQQFDEMDAQFINERNALFKTFGIDNKLMIDFMAIGYSLKPDMIADMVNKCALENSNSLK